MLQTEYRGLPVCLSVTVVSPAKTAEPIEMLFGLWAQVGSRNHIKWGPDPSWEGVNFDKEGDSHCKV